MRIRTVVFFTLSLCLFQGVFAQKKIKLQHFSTEDGLSQNTINYIFQDSRGFMWFCTHNGLNQFDGNSFTVLKNIEGDSTSIASNDIYTAFEDRNHNLWFGTSQGLSLFDRGKNSFVNFDYYPFSNRYTLNPVWSIIASQDKKELWLGASGGLFSFNLSSHQFSHVVINDSIQNANSVGALCTDKKGDIWVGTPQGLFRFDKRNKKLIWLEYNRTKKDNNIVRCLLKDREDNIWIGNEDGVLSKYDFQLGTFTHYEALKDKFPIRSILENSAGELWIGTDKGGVFIFEPKPARFVPLDYNRENGNDVIRSLCEDKKGDIWLGTYNGGAHLFDKLDTAFNYILPYPEINHPNESNSVMAVAEDKEGQLWLGTDGGGLIHWAGNQNIRYYKSNAPSNSIAGNTILCLSKGRDEKLYIGTYANGISVMDTRTGMFRNNQHDTAGHKSLNDNSVWAIYNDNEAYLWIGTNNGGLNLLNLRNETFRHFTNNLKDPTSISSNSIRCITKDSRNNLWIGTVSGLNLLNEKDSTFTRFIHTLSDKKSLSNSNILCIYEDSQKNLWLGTHGGGINLYNPKSRFFTNYKESNGLSGNIVYGILEDSQGNLWLSTNKGISKFNPATGEFKNFDTSSGLPSSQFNVGAFYKNPAGALFFGSINGLCSFSPHHIKENTYLPPIVLTDFALFNKTVTIGANSPLQKSITETREITLDYSQSVISFSFAALNYTHRDKNNYAYKLEPFDKEWNLVGNKHNATYTNLAPGVYTFKVKGSNNSRIWNEKYTSVKLIITPPFWKTTWFKLFSTLVTLSLILGVHTLQVNRIQKQKTILEKLVNQRTEEIEEKNKLIYETEMKNAQLLQQRLSDEIISKSQELTSYTLLIIQKNRLLDELKKKIKETIRQSNPNKLQDFKNLIRMINYSFSPEKEWREFNLNFNRLHAGFAETLKTNFPDLTPNDLRLCTLYRIDFPTKEIAEAMGISHMSVKMARYRLRKKLSLSPEDDLNEFLKQIPLH
jgi:ligand-binding sensor domain-containing protein/DNA-directed RNA polymerase specialized sigma24 family protein